MIRNLWEETEETLATCNKEWSDIKYVVLTSSEEIIPKDVYEEIARNTYYDNGFGSTEVYESLMLIGDGFWFERAEYDGAEWFAYKEIPDIRNYTVDLDCDSLTRNKR